MDNRAFHVQFSAFVAIDASPLYSLLGGNVIKSYISAPPQVTYQVLPQPLVARPYAGDTVVIEATPTVVAKPTVVYDKPKRIIYRKITCYR